MKIKISIPNDYGSEELYQAALQDIYGRYVEEEDAARAGEIDENGDEYNPWAEACQDNGEALYEELAFVAKQAGLKFDHATDYGAVWVGTKAKCEKAINTLPSWAYVGSVE